MLNDEGWVGTTADGRYFSEKGVKLPQLFGDKGTALMSDATSGGSSLVPFAFDEAVVQYPLLSAQLLPYVDMRDISTGDSVHTPRMDNVSVAWKQGPSEGSATVTLQTTDSLVDELDTSICDITAAGTLGLNFISDSPVNVLQEFQTRIVSKMAADLDRVVAKGSGSGEPKGIQNTSSPKTVTVTNGTAGPWLVADLLNIVETLPLQYRTGEYAPSVCWVMSDSAFFNIKGIVTGLSGDTRLIYGYDLQKYMLHNFPVRISNDLAANYAFFLPLKLYRMFRRKGIDFKITAEGQTLVLANLMLIAGRGRYGGQIVDANGVVVVSDGSVH